MAKLTKKQTIAALAISWAAVAVGEMAWKPIKDMFSRDDRLLDYAATKNDSKEKVRDDEDGLYWVVDLKDPNALFVMAKDGTLNPFRDAREVTWPETDSTVKDAVFKYLNTHVPVLQNEEGETAFAAYRITEGDFLVGKDGDKEALIAYENMKGKAVESMRAATAASMQDFNSQDDALESVASAGSGSYWYIDAHHQKAHLIVRSGFDWGLIPPHLSFAQMTTTALPVRGAVAAFMREAQEKQAGHVLVRIGDGPDTHLRRMDAGEVIKAGDGAGGAFVLTKREDGKFVASYGVESVAAPVETVAASQPAPIAETDTSSPPESSQRDPVPADTMSDAEIAHRVAEETGFGKIVEQAVSNNPAPQGLPFPDVAGSDGLDVVEDKSAPSSTPKPKFTKPSSTQKPAHYRTVHMPDF